MEYSSYTNFDGLAFSKLLFVAMCLFLYLVVEPALDLALALHQGCSMLNREFLMKAKTTMGGKTTWTEAIYYIV